MQCDPVQLAVKIVSHLCHTFKPLSNDICLYIADFLTNDGQSCGDGHHNWGSPRVGSGRLHFAELWSVSAKESWIVSCSQVSHPLRAMILPEIWREVALLTYGRTQRLDLLEALTAKLGSNRALVKHIKLSLLCAPDLVQRSGWPPVGTEDFDSKRNKSKYRTQSQFEEAVERMCEVFPADLHTFHYDCGQLRLTPRAWKSIARSCRRLTVLRLDARYERSSSE